MKVSAHVRVSGPLAAHAAGFAAWLTEQGYTELSLANQLRLMAHFSRWLAERELSIGALTPGLIGRYLALRRRTRTGWRSRRGLAPVLGYLGLTEAVAAPRRVYGELLDRYEHYLVERGVSGGVRAHYVAVAADLLDVRAPNELTGADVMRFARQLLDKPGQNGRLSALRSALRFLHVDGETTSALAAVVPSTTCWRHASLPKALEPAQVRAVLASPDRRTTTGARDYAVLLLMLRLGLRACEVAALSLDDLDWARGEITVRGKGSTGRLPMPRDVGQALVSWLRRRRAVPTRGVFLCSRAPYRAASASTIVGLAGRVLRDAGVPTGGGHRLRHTAATMMLRRGASMTEIAQVLRHRHIDTTAIYAKVDREGLRELAQPWPIAADHAAALGSLAQPWPWGVS
jgi:integrase/recombinase XerD